MRSFTAHIGEGSCAHPLLWDAFSFLFVEVMIDGDSWLSVPSPTIRLYS